MIGYLIAGLAVGLIIGIVLGYVLCTARSVKSGSGSIDLQARERAASAEATSQALHRENALLRDQTQRDQSMLQALGPLRAQLAQVQEQVQRLEQERTHQYAQITEQLRVAAHNDQVLANSTQSLVGALRSNSARGQWGEVELRRVLEASGLMRHVDFVEQAAFRQTDGSSSRPDVVVNLPGNKHLVIDAKVPLSHYLDAINIPEHAQGQEQARRRELLAAHVKDVRAHIDALSKRDYPATVGVSPELTAMFLPNESLLSAACDADPGLLEYALARNIAPVTPSSLFGLLKTVATIWQQFDITDEAERFVELGRELYRRLGTMAEHVTRMGTSLSGTVDAYNKFVGSLESRVLVTARKIDSLDTTGLHMAETESLVESPRPVIAPELLIRGNAQDPG